MKQFLLCLIPVAFFGLFILLTYAITTHNNVTDQTHIKNINLRLVKINSDCSLTNDKFRQPQLCNTILLETLTEPKLYKEINTCDYQAMRNIHINNQWLYNHRIGDTIHFDYILKRSLFTIKKELQP